MPTPLQTLSRPHRNKLLAYLDPADFAALEPHLQSVSLDFRQELYDYRQHVTHIYFPLSGVVAVMRTLRDGDSAQVASVGNEGVVGYGALIDAPIASGRGVVQLPGEALRIEVAVIGKYALERPRFRAVVMHYGHVLISQLMQSVVCQRFHSARERYAVWLLQTHDRAHRQDGQAKDIPAAEHIAGDGVPGRRGDQRGGRAQLRGGRQQNGARFVRNLALSLSGSSYSSIGIDQLRETPGEHSGIMLGTPLSVRSDEWATSTPALLRVMATGSTDDLNPLTADDEFLHALPAGPGG